MKSFLTLIAMTLIGFSAHADLTDMFTCQGLRDANTRIFVTVGVNTAADGLARAVYATVKVNDQVITPNAACYPRGAGLICIATVGDETFEAYPSTYNLLGTQVVWGVNVYIHGGTQAATTLSLIQCTRN